MAKLLKICFFLLIFGLFYDSSAAINELEKKAVRNAMKKLSKLPSFLGQAFELYETFENIGDMLKPGDGPLDTDDRLDMIIDKLDELSSDMKAFEGRLTQKINQVHTTETLDNSLKDLSKIFNKINEYYEDFENYVNDTLVFREDQIKGFAEAIIEPRKGVSNILNRMHDSFTSSTGTLKIIPMLLLDSEISPEFMCALQQSPQQIIHTLYQKMLLSEVKGYAMLIFSHELLDAINDGPQKTSNKDVETGKFKKRIGKTFGIVRRTMKYASREVWRCDRKNPVEKRHYARFGPVFQKFAMLESDAVNLETKRAYYECETTCPDLKLTQRVRTYYSRTNSDQCYGNVRDCERKGASLSYCFANDEYRRYQYFEIDGKFYGNTTCKMDPVTGLKELPNMIKILNPCSYCICTCEDVRDPIDKYVSLRPVYSDYRDNKVITGAQVKLINNIFHIEIQQGVLLENGRIDPTTIGSKINDSSIRDKNVRKGEDYYEISWESKTICLDNVDSTSSPYKRNHVLTGLQFQKVNNQLQLSVHVSKFNPQTGVLVNNERNPKQHFLESDNRLMFSLDGRNVPTKFENPKPLPARNQCFELTNSNFKEDAGQNVLPFIDIQPIRTSPPSPLSGAGLFLRSDLADASGGYLALKLFTLDLEHFIKRPTVEDNLGKLED